MSALSCELNPNTCMQMFNSTGGCLTCDSYWGGGREMRPPLMPIEVGGPFERVGKDILEMPFTMNRNCFVVVFMENLTKWVERSICITSPIQ